MSTWHQDKALREGRLKVHAVRESWTVVIDPPNRPMYSLYFHTEKQARECAERFDHSFVVPPRGEL